MSDPTPPAPDGASAPDIGAVPNGNAAPDGNAVPANPGGAALRRFTLWLLLCGAALVAGGALWGGLDFAAAVLLGVLIVLLNFAWTKRTVRSILFAGQPRAMLLLSLLVKFGVTGAVLYYAILRMQVSALGVAVGLSAVLLASVAITLDGSVMRR